MGHDWIAATKLSTLRASKALPLGAPDGAADAEADAESETAPGALASAVVVPSLTTPTRGAERSPPQAMSAAHTAYLARMIQLPVNPFIWLLPAVVVSALLPAHVMPSATMPPHRPPAPVVADDASHAGTADVGTDVDSDGAPGAPVVHLRLTKSEPAQHDTLTVAPSTIRLWFSQRAELRTMRVTLLSATGDTVSLGALTRSATADAPVVAPVQSPLVNGTYTVQWRTMASDGHVVRGEFAFVVRGAL